MFINMGLEIEEAQYVYVSVNYDWLNVLSLVRHRLECYKSRIGHHPTDTQLASIRE